MPRAIGYWIENLQDTNLPAPQELVGDLPAADRATLASYLKKGAVLETWRGYSWCRFRCGIPSNQMGNRDLTDGSCAWPEGLHHYVTAHSLLLPDEFIQHALSRPALKNFFPHTRPDLSFWIHWAATKRSPAVLEKFHLTRHASESSAKELRRERIAAETLSKGISDSRCIMSGCANHALNGIRFCAEHSLSLSDRS